MKPIRYLLSWFLLITNAQPDGWQWRFARAVIRSLAWWRGYINGTLKRRYGFPLFLPPPAPRKKPGLFPRREWGGGGPLGRLARVTTFLSSSTIPTIIPVSAPLTASAAPCFASGSSDPFIISAIANSRFHAHWTATPTATVFGSASPSSNFAAV
jgi:hypothetical protein